MNRRAKLLLGAVALPLVAAAVTSHALHGAPQVERTFAFFGCNRIDAKDVEETASVNPSTANIPQLKQNLADIAALKTNETFFGGDLVMGYADDKGEVLKKQVTAWLELVKTLPKYAKSEYVVISGNHEKNRKAGELKLPNPPTDGIWSGLVKQAGLVPADAKGPTPATDAKDGLIADQSALSFSFNRGSVHFVCLDTDTRVKTIDPETKETKIGMIPTAWLDADLDAAEKNGKIRCVVVMGHRNVIDPESIKGDAPIDDACAKPMIASLIAHKKVRAYVCAHVHAFDISTINNSSVKQVCFGNGGSKLEKNWKPESGRTYGFGYFKVYTDGSLGVIPYLRPEPKNYMDASPDKVPAAKPQQELVIPVR